MQHRFLGVAYHTTFELKTFEVKFIIY